MTNLVHVPDFIRLEHSQIKTDFIYYKGRKVCAKTFLLKLNPMVWLNPLVDLHFFICIAAKIAAYGAERFWKKTK